MDRRIQALIVAALLASIAAVVWMFRGHAANEGLVGNANVIGGLAGVAALIVALLTLWPRKAGQTDAVSRPAAEQRQAAAEYLARETLRYWQQQAKDRRIVTPSPAAVAWRWADQNVAVPAGQLQSKLLTEGVVTELREQLYGQLPDPARVVILGGPGAGKTTAMLLLLIDILRAREPGSTEPVPVWLTLGGWNPDTTSLQEWAAATLKRTYPGLEAAERGGPGTAQRLILADHVALFLDGLDEMPPAMRATALTKLDRDAAGLRLVLTSRPEEYRSAVEHGRLWGAAVIDVLPVDVDHARAFLLAEQLGDRHQAWRHVTDYLKVNPDSVAARTLTSPLALTLARDAYARSDPADLLNSDSHPTPDALLRHLLVRSVFFAYPDRAERLYAAEWLSLIASCLDGGRDLRWWDISTWAPLKQRVVFFGLLGPVIGLAVGLAVALVVGLAVGLAVGVVVGLAVGLWALPEWESEPKSLVVRWPDPREIREAAKSWAQSVLGLVLVVMLAWGFAAGLMVGLVAVLVATLVAVLMFALTGGITLGWWGMLGFGLAGGLTVGLGGGLGLGLGLGFVGGLVVDLVDSLLTLWGTPLATTGAATPIEVYRSDRKRTGSVGLVAGLVGGLVVGLGSGLSVGLGLGLVSGLAAMLAGVLIFGRGPALELTMVELIWALRGQRVRFIALLQTALDRQVLRQAGPVYQFRHAALQDLLANPVELAARDQPSPSRSAGTLTSKPSNDQGNAIGESTPET
ncbi:NACHT domain-containing protein [Dactylosporangium sp. NPDC048998]|uniref:NACHT domain-containing protein n=1 Tax=Dactylosporangium sp. NPDC048998 TaxID=3363976 RepID=UPI0037188A69